MGWSEYAYRDADALDAALAESLRSLIAESLAAHGRVCLALAGGRTPLALYRRLAAQALPWSQVTLVPTDERCVPHAHPACNLTALRAAWSQAQDLAWVPLTPADGDADRAEAVARAKLATIAASFDGVVLGMGADAHTASLFPGAPQLAAALAPDAPDALRQDPAPLPPDAPYPRITLSAARLRRAHALHLVIVGADKLAALRRAQASHDPDTTPISALLHADDVRLHIHWSP